ncbi:succinate dehydrogenase cytochrome b subunit [Agromyces protaetiae]|uniref:Succinate dehydrogenase cytochrome b subunit n=1 Tax=Agromyces protaetiae TaxID=2509455 RepID=A0A4P6FA74_9MICO|nr:succinate dehydrogenase cytochrome b subunit [Agromyces protaetiae]QAY72852.1 succinate dehydrogenase cytochrome b subunit [Agromyces protaetiae]
MAVSTAPTSSSGGAATRSRKPWISSFWLKIIMAVTGVIFAAFVLVHMIGNLKVYQGAEAFDSYAHWLREVLYPLLPHEGVLWALRIVLSVSLVAHVWAAVVLSARARKARGPVRRRGLPLRSFAARTMLVTGIVLLAFVIFHILDLTIGAQPAASDSFEAGSAYANLVASFQRPWVAVFYILAMVVLALHVSHGLWTATHDLGATGKRLRAIALAISGIVAIVIMIGNISIPFAVLIGVVK